MTERIQPRGGLWWKLAGLGRLGPQVSARIAQSRARALIELGRTAEAVRILSEDDIATRLMKLEETIPGWASLQVAACWLYVGDLARASEWAERSFEQAGAVGLHDCERLAINIASGADGARGIRTRSAYVRRLRELPPGVGGRGLARLCGRGCRTAHRGRRRVRTRRDAALRRRGRGPDGAAQRRA